MKSRDAITSKTIHLWVTYNQLSWVKTRDAIASKILFSKIGTLICEQICIYHTSTFSKWWIRFLCFMASLLH